MNKKELVAAIAKKSGLTQVDAAKAVAAFIQTVGEATAKGETVTLIGFGSFSVKKRAARKGVNPRTKAPITIPAKKYLAFKASKESAK